MLCEWSYCARAREEQMHIRTTAIAEYFNCVANRLIFMLLVKNCELIGTPFAGWYSSSLRLLQAASSAWQMFARIRSVERLGYRRGMVRTGVLNPRLAIAK